MSSTVLYRKKTCWSLSVVGGLAPDAVHAVDEVEAAVGLLAEDRLVCHLELV